MSDVTRDPYADVRAYDPAFATLEGNVAADELARYAEHVRASIGFALYRETGLSYDAITALMLSVVDREMGQ